MFSAAVKSAPIAPQAQSGVAPRIPVVRSGRIARLLAAFDAPMLLALLAAACLVRRRPVVRPSNARRRVPHVIPSLAIGGAQVQLAEVLNRTPRDRYDVELLVLGDADAHRSLRGLNRDDVEISFLEEWPRLSRSVLEVMRRCRSRRYDLVHAWLPMANIVAAAGARLAGVPTVIASVRSLSVSTRRDWYRKWWHRAADVLGSHAADVVTVSAHALVGRQARWAWMRRSRIQVIPNGIDASRFLADPRDSRRRIIEEAGVPADAVLVGTVARLAHENDLATFVRIIVAVRRVRPDVRGIVIGNGELRPQLEALADALSLGEGSIVFLGERPDARRLMAGFDLFLLTSRCEGFSNALLEATLLGVPCVATDLAGNPDVVKVEESLFPAGNIDAGAARVLARIANPNRTASQQQFLRKRAATFFTAERSVAAWLDLYRRGFELRGSRN